MPFNLFHRKKPEEAPTPEPTPEPAPETPVEATPEPAEPTSPVEEPVEQQTPDPESTPEVEPEAPAAEPAAQEQPEEQPAEPIAEVVVEPQPQEQTAETAAAEPQPEPEQPIAPPAEEQQEEPEATPVEAAKIYLKAMPLKDLADVESVKDAVSNGNIIILRITPLAGKSIEDVKKAVNDLFEFAESTNGDIARLGEERVVICPKTVRIWREKTPAPVAKRDPLPPTTA